jgi:hypothetical protein
VKYEDLSNASTAAVLLHPLAELLPRISLRRCGPYFPKSRRPMCWIFFAVSSGDGFGWLPLAPLSGLPMLALLGSAIGSNNYVTDGFASSVNGRVI